MFEYHDKSRWNNSVLAHVVVSASFWLPFTALFFAVAFHSGSLEIYLMSFSASLIFALFLFHRSQTKIVLPTVEACGQHLILNMPLTKRTVYNLGHIKGAKFFWHILYLRHMGWPVLTPLPRMPIETRRQLLGVLGGS